MYVSDRLFTKREGRMMFSTNNVKERVRVELCLGNKENHGNCEKVSNPCRHMRKIKSTKQGMKRAV